MPGYGAAKGILNIEYSLQYKDKSAHSWRIIDYLVVCPDNPGYQIRKSNQICPDTGYILQEHNPDTAWARLKEGGVVNIYGTIYPYLLTARHRLCPPCKAD